MWSGSRSDGPRGRDLPSSSPDASQELPLILGQLPVLSEKSWAGEGFFRASSLDIPMGSGPYRIGEFKAGQRLTYRARSRSTGAATCP